MKVYGTSPNGERVEITGTPTPTRVIIPPKIAYAQAWKDLKEKYIDQITDKEDGTLFACDLKKLMDEMLIDYHL